MIGQDAVRLAVIRQGAVRLAVIRQGADRLAVTGQDTVKLAVIRQGAVRLAVTGQDTVTVGQAVCDVAMWRSFHSFCCSFVSDTPVPLCFPHLTCFFYPYN